MSKGWKIAFTVVGILVAFGVVGAAFALGNWVARRQISQSQSVPSFPFRPRWGRDFAWRNLPRRELPRGGRSGMPYQPYRYSARTAPALTVDEVKSAAEAYVQRLGLSGLEVSEVMIFDNGGYVIVSEAASGIAAFELLVDPWTKVAYPEPGANMMWNQKYGALNHYGMMSAHHGWAWGVPAVPEISAEMALSEDQAKEVAQKFLDGYLPGASVEKVTRFYGYYTLDYAKDGKVVGMLSVNGFSGQVWPHTWHGQFLEEWEH